MAHAYPLMLDVTDCLVVIIGGGAVAARKAKGLIEAGARRVRIVSPTFDSDIPDTVERLVATYESSHLDGATLVFATTDSPDVNDTIVRDARERGVLVNRADEADGGDFVTPARFQEGEVIVTVSAGSPALAVAIRNELARRIDRRHLKMAHAMQQLRPLVLGGGLAREKRAAIFRDLASDEAIAKLDAESIEALRGWISGRHPELQL